jgi:hypothetical protein
VAMGYTGPDREIGGFGGMAFGFSSTMTSSILVSSSASKSFSDMVWLLLDNMWLLYIKNLFMQVKFEIFPQSGVIQHNLFRAINVQCFQCSFVYE